MDHIGLSTKLNVRSSSWRIMNFHICMQFILSSIIRFFITKVHCAFATCSWIIAWKLAVQLFFFFFLLKFLSFLFLFIFILILSSQHYIALIVVFVNYFKKDLLEAFGLSSSAQPKDQFD